MASQLSLLLSQLVAEGNNADYEKLKKKYPDQFIFIIQVEDYVYLVPFVEKENEIILKTIIPSRKATKHYLRRDD
jgi:hypothetical protein